MPPPSVDGITPSPSDGGECLTCPGVPGSSPKAADPIDLASGLVTLRNVDLSISGTRGTVAMARVYRTLSTNSGAFGLGSETPYNYKLDTYDPKNAATINLIAPDGNRFPFSIQPNGTFVNSSVPWLRGAVLTATGTYVNGGTANVASLRFKDGAVWTFEVTEIDSDLPSGCNFYFSALASQTDRFGNQTTLTRDCTKITAITDPVGRQLNLTYNSNNSVTSITDPIGRTVLYTYNPSGTLATVTDANGGLSSYQYDSQNRMTGMIDPRGVTMFQNTFDANGRVIQQVAADGGIYKFAYTLINASAPTSPVASTTVTDPLGNQTTYRFNPQGYVIQATDALGQTTAFNRAPGTNLLLSVTGNALCPVCAPRGAGPSSYTYDLNGNLLTSTDALGNTTTYTYDPTFNQVASITDALNNTSNFAYDTSGNLISVTDQNRNKSTFAYNANGLLLSATDPVGNKTSISYDQYGNPVSVTDALGNVSTSTFDLASRLVKATDPQGRFSQATYDGLNRVISATDGSGYTTQFGYDPVGNLLKLTDPRGNATAFVYDALSRVTTRTSPLGKSETYQYDSDGNLTQYTDRRSQVSKFQYDTLNRLAKETYQDGSIVARAYDPYSRLLTVNDSVAGLFGFNYDANGSLVSQTEPTGTVNYTRDQLHRVATRQVAGQSQVTYAYDPVGNLLNASMPSAGLTNTYDARNLPVAASRTNGVTTSEAFDPLGRVLSLTHAKGTTTLNTQTYSFDQAGNLINSANSISQPLITQATTGTVDQANELLTSGSTTYTYDANGNRLTETNPSGTLTYSWDSRNRLASIVDSSGNTTAMKYDFARNLLALTRTTGGSTTTQQFVVDSLTNVVSLTTTTGLPVSVLTGRSIDSHYASVDSSGTIAFGIGDNLGSTTAVTNSAGSVISGLDYEPYGQTSGTAAATFPFAYSGRVLVSGNIYYYRNRFYDTRVGRFLSEDPLAPNAGENAYAYVGGSPADSSDPSGLIKVEPTLKGALTVAGGVGLVWAATTVASPALIAAGVLYGGYQIGWGLAKLVGGLANQDLPGGLFEALARSGRLDPAAVAQGNFIADAFAMPLSNRWADWLVYGLALGFDIRDLGNSSQQPCSSPGGSRGPAFNDFGDRNLPFRPGPG